MSIPKPTISPLVVTDLPTLAQFLFTSQLSQPTNQFLFSNWPNEAAQIALYIAGMEKSFADPLVEMYKATDTTSGEIVATLILTRSKPPAAPVAAPIAETAAVSNAGTTPPTGVIPAFHAVLKRMLADVQKRMDGVDHFGKVCPLILGRRRRGHRIANEHSSPVVHLRQATQPSRGLRIAPRTALRRQGSDCWPAVVSRICAVGVGVLSEAWVCGDRACRS